MDQIIESEGRFCRQTKRKGYAARVFLQLARNTPTQKIEIRSSGRPPRSFAQGDIEDGTHERYEDWQAGARVGVEYALRIAGEPNCFVAIIHIYGLTTDTNPTVVAAAAAHATWRAINFSPASQEIERLEKIALGSWDFPHNYVPTL